MKRKNIISAILSFTMAMSCVSAFTVNAKETPNDITIYGLQTSSTTGISLMSTGNTATYTGGEITPKIAVYAEDGTVLTEGTDYTLSYENNINVGTATIIVNFIGNYTGTRRVTFTIVAKGATEENTTISEIADLVYTGGSLTPEPTIIVDGTTLKKDVDYTLSYEDNVNAGTATVTVEFTGNYSGELSTTFEITKAALTDDDVTFANIENQEYTGGAITPEPTITYGDVPLVKDEDYTLTYENNTELGTASVKVEFIGNYSGTASTTFEIVAKAATADNTVISNIEDIVFSGTPAEPKPAVAIDGVELKEGIDYEISYSNNTNVGTATAEITFKGNYSGTASTTFEIVTKAATADNTVISEIGNVVYTGSAIEPKPTVTVDGVELTEGVDYEMSYANNVDYGEATATITFIGNYSGETSINFKIVGKELSNDDVTISAIESVTYTGKEITPEPTIAYGNEVFKKDVDYTITYENNINAGTATVVITFTNEYAGTVTTTFEITPKIVTEDNISVDDISTQKYTGKEITPIPVVRDLSLA